MKRTTIYINEDSLRILKEDGEREEKVTFFKFLTEIKKFLKELLNDPIYAKPDMFFREHGISKSVLINKLIERDVLVREEDIREPEDANGEKKSTHYVKYNVKRKNFETRIRRLYTYFFETGKKI